MDAVRWTGPDAKAPGPVCVLKPDPDQPVDSTVRARAST
jgi:hypothetical protein